MGLLFLFVTSKSLREANEFSWFPIMEVAKLFAGIFMTIIPALAAKAATANPTFIGYLTGISANEPP